MAGIHVSGCVNVSVSGFQSFTLTPTLGLLICIRCRFLNLGYIENGACRSQQNDTFPQGNLIVGNDETDSELHHF